MTSARRDVPKLIFIALVTMAVLGGCSPDPVNETHQGRLEAGDPTHHQDSSFYDEYTFKAKEGWQITVNQTSTEFDSFLHLMRNGDDDWNEQNDDVEAGNLNAQISIIAPATDTYTVWANTRAAGETGAYTVTIAAQPVQGGE
jgi:hypothetical protein